MNAMTANSAPRLMAWMPKFLLGWLIFETIVFIALAAVFGLSFNQLRAPLVALLVPGALTGLLIMNALGHKVERPKSASVRFAVAMLVCLSLCLSIFVYYGTRLSLFRRDSTSTILVTGILIAVFMSFRVYYRSRRRLQMSRPDSQ
jgi:hypothetical protein